MGDISEHISRHEVACPCGCGVKTADKELVYVIEDVCSFFSKRNHNSRVIAHFNSWNRCEKYDKEMKIREGYEITGKLSEHCVFWATDFWLEIKSNGIKTKIPPRSVANYLEDKYPLKYGIGRYNNRTHIDMRQIKARWGNDSK